MRGRTRVLLSMQKGEDDERKRKRERERERERAKTGAWFGKTGFR